MDSLSDNMICYPANGSINHGQFNFIREMTIFPPPSLLAKLFFHQLFKFSLIDSFLNTRHGLLHFRSGKQFAGGDLSQ